MDTWQTHIPKQATEIGPGVAYGFGRCQADETDKEHEHTLECIWVWHYCTEKLGPTSVAPSSNFGWRPSGVEAHTLEQLEPITLSPSVYWPECCEKHGFITQGRYYDV